MKLTHTRILVNNYKECYHFYKDNLSFECTWGDENSNYAQFQVGNTQLAIFDKKQMLEHIKVSNDANIDTPLNEVVLIFAVDAVDEIFHSLKSKVQFISEPHNREDWGIRVAHFRDPNGTLIEINTNV
jgi:lactoylglutathione lyase